MSPNQKKLADTLSAMVMRLRLEDVVDEFKPTENKRRRPLAYRLPDAHGTNRFDGTGELFDHLWTSYQSQAQAAGWKDTDFFTVLAAIYYAPPNPSADDNTQLAPCPERIADIYNYLDNWKNRRWPDRFIPTDLPKLVFMYALGIERHERRFDGEHADWSQLWSPAVWALRLELTDLGGVKSP